MDATNPKSNIRKGVFVDPGQDNFALGFPGFHLRQFLESLRRHYKIIVLTAMVVLGLAILVTSLLPYRFTSNAILVIDESESQLVGVEAVLSAGTTLNNRVDTEVEILKSSSVALEAIEKLKLWRDEEFGIKAPLLARIRAYINGMPLQLIKADAGSIDELADSEHAELVKNLGDALRISRRGITSVISIGATSLSPEKAAKIANAIAESYFDVLTDARAKSAERAAEYLRQRVDELATAIKSDNNRIDRFFFEQRDVLQQHNIGAELKRLTDQMASVYREHANKAAQLEALQNFQSDMNSHPNLTGGLGDDIDRLVEERGRMLQSNQTDSEAAMRLKDIETSLRTLADEQIQGLRGEIGGYETRLSDIRKQMNSSIASHPLPPSVGFDLYRLHREAETNRKLYESYVARLGEVQQKANLAMPNSRVIATAIVPHEPSFPPSILILAIGVVLAGGLGTGAALIRENLVGGFASPEQLEAVTHHPVVAVVPHYGNDNPQDAIFAQPFSVFAESIRRLRIGIENMLDSSQSNVILVTSTEPEEGKTTLAVSLARAMASSGRRTLLIDCDLRKSSVQRTTRNRSSAKLNDLLASELTEEKFERAPAYEKETGLYLLDADSTRRHASDVLFASANFTKLIALAKSRFDAIVLDSPPIGYVVDAQVICRECDIVLYGVRFAATTQRDVVAGLRELLSVPKRPQLVLALNSARAAFGGYYHRSNAGDYYGSGSH